MGAKGGGVETLQLVPLHKMLCYARARFVVTFWWRSTPARRRLVITTGEGPASYFGLCQGILCKVLYTSCYTSATARSEQAGCGLVTTAIAIRPRDGGKA